MPEPRGVLLVGSVPLSNSEDVFRTASSILGGRLRRIPDGEMGERSDWIVPSGFELGYHLCYGDAKHRHFKEPDDAAKLVDIANALAAGVDRPLQWIHMPVPRSRDDDAYFAPLHELRIDDETELYLGLVHNTDGVDGARRRIQAAQKVRERFGVATECGMGRRPPETIPGLLRIHAAVSG